MTLSAPCTSDILSCAGCCKGNVVYYYRNIPASLNRVAKGVRNKNKKDGYRERVTLSTKYGVSTFFLHYLKWITWYGLKQVRQMKHKIITTYSIHLLYNLYLNSIFISTLYIGTTYLYTCIHVHVHC